MFNLEENRGTDGIDSRSGESLDKIYKKRGTSPQPITKNFPSQERLQINK
jgi:hypothetical protein